MGNLLTTLRLRAVTEFSREVERLDVLNRSMFASPVMMTCSCKGRRGVRALRKESRRRALGEGGEK